MALPLSPRRVTFVGIAVIVIVLLAWMVASYNSLVTRDQAVSAQWAQVENRYQLKIDLIPQLVSVARQYTQFERSTLENITRLRSQWQNATTIDQRINTSMALDQNFFAIRVTYERYPELQSIQLVQSLMFSIESAETQIATERMRYNEAVRVYNTKVQTFPDLVWAGAFGFHVRTYYDPIPGGP